MERFWQILERASLRIGNADATGLGVICLTIICVAALLTMAQP
ncbi:hypothetical protein [Terricaulis silvestris]|uniref:Uncharacterized protein n=1 Tax=Terricaulis silvestris TaxID=2686094 RepID=A0A6I6MJW3_9CAUL|nr:hypothetical protein [Terricaulis silvestris]QGZ94969.1 hypothetical protein DSM104635_01804 [Terricaulis silvestris]